MYKHNIIDFFTYILSYWYSDKNRFSAELPLTKIINDGVPLLMTTLQKYLKVNLIFQNMKLNSGLL